MNPIVRIAIALAVLLSGIAIVPFADAQSGTFAWQKFANAYECTENCNMRIAHIALEFEPFGDKFLVRGYVTVVDENGDPVTNAVVSGEWTKPNEISYGTRENTGEDGIAMFQTVSREGLYTLTIRNVVKDDEENWTFDLNNSILTGTIIIPEQPPEESEQP